MVKRVLLVLCVFGSFYLSSLYLQVPWAGEYQLSPMTADYHSSYGWVIPLFFVGPLVSKWLLTGNALCIPWELRDLTLPYTPLRYLSVQRITCLEILSKSVSPATKEQTCYIDSVFHSQPACSPTNTTFYTSTLSPEHRTRVQQLLSGPGRNKCQLKKTFFLENNQFIWITYSPLLCILYKLGTFWPLSGAWSFTKLSTLGCGWKLFLPKWQLSSDWGVLSYKCGCAMLLKQTSK